MRKLLILLSLLVVASMVLAGCLLVGRVQDAVDDLVLNPVAQRLCPTAIDESLHNLDVYQIEGCTWNCCQRMTIDKDRHEIEHHGCS